MKSIFNKIDSAFIIAEISANHNQSLEKAIKLVEVASQCGVDAVKFQTYTPDTITLKSDRAEFQIKDPNSLWNGQSLYELYKSAYMPWEWHQPLFKRCQELGVLAFSSPFDFSAVDLLEELNVPAYKIASFENADLPLIKKCAATKKPMIISTGMASVAELALSVDTARNSGCEDLVLLKCTSCYPANHANANLKTLPNMADLFHCTVGISDHTPGIGTAVAAVALGAKVIEKHFTLARADGGPDAEFSLEPDELKALVVETKRAQQSIGSVQYGPTENELGSLQFRRSLYAVKNINKGDEFTSENIRSVRPSNGLAPKYYEMLFNHKAKTDIKTGTPLNWELVD